jgi:hypothetical protein
VKGVGLRVRAEGLVSAVSTRPYQRAFWTVAFAFLAVMAFAGVPSPLYRILVAIGAIPGVANVFQEQILRVPASPGGLFQERPGTEFGAGAGRPITREESRAAARRLYDGVIATGRADDVDMVAEGYIQNSG